MAVHEHYIRNPGHIADLLINFDPAITDFSIKYSCQELGCDDEAVEGGVYFLKLAGENLARSYKLVVVK